VLDVKILLSNSHRVATVSTIDKIWARGGEAHRAEAAARHQGRSK